MRAIGRLVRRRHVDVVLYSHGEDGAEVHQVIAIPTLTSGQELDVADTGGKNEFPWLCGWAHS